MYLTKFYQWSDLVAYAVVILGEWTNFFLHLSQHTVKWDVCVDRGHSITTLTIRGGWGVNKKSIKGHVTKVG